VVILLTVRGDRELVSRGMVQEGAFVEHLVAGLIVVGKSNLDLAVLDLSQGDGKRRVPPLQVNGGGGGGGHKGSKCGQSELHVDE
jgi:hypothetical protein